MDLVGPELNVEEKLFTSNVACPSLMFLSRRRSDRPGCE